MFVCLRFYKGSGWLLNLWPLDLQSEAMLTVLVSPAKANVKGSSGDQMFKNKD